MYCINCGVKLGDSEKKCPLCGTVVPVLRTDTDENSLYPKNKMPKIPPNSKVLSGSILILCFLPLMLTLFADMSDNGKLNWFGYVAGGIVVSYITFALPIWFRKPNPVIFVPCDFVATAIFLLYINLLTKGEWFLNFALPSIIGLALITCTLVTLLRYLKKGRLFIVGGCMMGLGVWTFTVELLMTKTFEMAFLGWSVYVMITLLLVGGLLLYVAINKTLREKISRKMFF